MRLSVLTYNLFCGAALYDAMAYQKKLKPDVLCVQEIPVGENEPRTLEDGTYKLACCSNTFSNLFTIYGNATYVNTEKFKIVSDYDDSLPASMYDFWVYVRQGIYLNRRFTETQIEDIKTGQRVAIYNVHTTHLSFVDLRISQIRTVFDAMEDRVGRKMPVVVMGDFNLYNGKTELEKLLTEYNLSEATNELSYTFKHKTWLGMLTQKLDYILYRDMERIQTKRYDKLSSDHFPIFTELETT
jgi:endonuclease/exonuclease/phosphatase family metal-dependent hydrolase